jgi:DNA-binding SARP family transcriptional activator
MTTAADTGEAPVDNEHELVADSGSQPCRTALPQLRLLSGFELRHRGEVVDLAPSARRLLAFLALHDRPLARIYVAGNMWLDSSEVHASANLRTTLWRLRRPGCPLVRATSTHLALEDRVAVDLREVATRAQRALEHRAERGDVTHLCLAGDLLPDWYDDWLLIERERFRQLRLHALEALCDDFAAAGQYATATEAGIAAVSGEPLRESAHRALIRAHLAEGNLCEAIRQYATYRDLLRRELGLEPSEEMKRLVEPLAAARRAPVAGP